MLLAQGFLSFSVPGPLWPSGEVYESLLRIFFFCIKYILFKKIIFLNGDSGCVVCHLESHSRWPRGPIDRHPALSNLVWGQSCELLEFWASSSCSLLSTWRKPAGLHLAGLLGTEDCSKGPQISPLSLNVPCSPSSSWGRIYIPRSLPSEGIRSLHCLVRKEDRPSQGYIGLGFSIRAAHTPFLPRQGSNPGKPRSSVHKCVNVSVSGLGVHRFHQILEGIYDPES